MIKRILNSMYKLLFRVLLGAVVVVYGGILYMEYFSSLATIHKVQQMYNRIQAQTGSRQTYVPLVVVDEDTINAYTDGSVIVIYTGLINSSDTWDEVALVLGHEIAHVNLGHLTNFEIKSPGEMAVLEANADKLGAVYAMKAGYDVCKGREFFKRLRLSGGNYQGLDHPDYSYRYDELNINCE